jgi:hemerythrin-like metal-binding protein
MTEYRCPAAEKNREAHGEFTKTISDFQRRYAESGYRASDARELVDTLDRWFSDHILSIDADLKQHVGK